jgi:hypothetical protein
LRKKQHCAACRALAPLSRSAAVTPAGKKTARARDADAISRGEQFLLLRAKFARLSLGCEAIGFPFECP